MKTLIKNGTLVTAESSFQADLLIEGEHIIQIAPSIEAADAEVVDASGQLVLPGGIDAHVHINLPMGETVSSDDYYTGSKAAAFGGTTTIIDFVSQDAGSLAENIARKRAEAEGKAAIDYSLHMNVAGEVDQLAYGRNHGVRACQTGLVCPWAKASAVRTSMTSPFSACTIVSKPCLPAMRITLKISPSPNRRRLL